MKTVKEVMTKQPECCAVDTTLQEVAEKMLNLNCGEIPVLDDQDKLVGVITDRDIVTRSLALGKNPMDMQASDCMTTYCISVPEDASVTECCAVMAERQIRRVPVVDEEDHCVGIVSQADIALKATDKTAAVVQEISKVG